MKKLKIKTRSWLIGIFILSAYAMLSAEFTQSKAIVLLSDVISGFSVMAIALLLYPLLAPSGKIITRAYLILKITEGTMMLAGGLFFVFDKLQYLRAFIYELPHLCTFIMGGAALYYLLYKSRLVPRFISVWGMIALAVLIIQTVLNLLGIENDLVNMLLVLIITNEVFLAVWLMIKGLKIPEAGK